MPQIPAEDRDRIMADLARVEELSPRQRRVVEALARQVILDMQEEKIAADPVPTERRRDLFEGLPGGPVMDFGKGAAKGIGSTGLGILELLQKAPGNPVSEGLKALLPEETLQEIRSSLEPSSGMETTGKTIEQIGEFLIPGAALGKGGTIGNVLRQALGSGGVAAAQTGGDPESVGMAAALSALGPLASKGAAAQAASKGKGAGDLLSLLGGGSIGQALGLEGMMTGTGAVLLNRLLRQAAPGAGKKALAKIGSEEELVNLLARLLGFGGKEAAEALEAK